MSVASAAGLVAFDTAAVAPASKISSSRADSGASVSTITAIAVARGPDLPDQLDGTIGLVHLVDQHDVGTRLDDLLDRRGPSIQVPEQVELAALAQRDRDRLDDQRVLGDDDHSLQAAAFPNRYRFNKGPSP